MKRIVYFFLVASVLLCLLITSAAAVETVASGSCLDSTTLTWVLDDAGTLTISGTGVLTGGDNDLASPWQPYRDSIRKVVVEEGITAIDYYGLGFLYSVEEIILPDSLTSLGYNAFACCRQLSQVDLPDGLTHIGDYAFSSCENLSHLDLPEGLVSLGKGAFMSCGLEKITIPEQFTEIPDYLFLYCIHLKEVTLPSKVDRIGAGAFSACHELSELSIPYTATYIGEGAFESCISLKTMSLSAYITEILPDTFRGCSALTQIILPGGLRTIGDNAFASCKALETLYLPNTLQTIGKKAFYQCKTLESVIFYEDLVSIGAQAFAQCEALSAAVFFNGATTFPSDCFNKCSEDLTLWAPPGSQAESCALAAGLPCGTADEENRTFCATSADGLTWQLDDFGCLTISGEGNMMDYPEELRPDWEPFIHLIEQVIIKENITSIGANAFQKYPYLHSVMLGHTVTTIGEMAFTDCPRLGYLELGAEFQSFGPCVFDNCPMLGYFYLSPYNTHCMVYNNVLYTADGSTLLWCPPATGHETYVIPDGVTAIADYAFYQATGLKEVILPSSVTTIGTRAFSGCTGMIALDVPDSVTTVGLDAFRDCSLLLKPDILSRPVKSSNLGLNNYSYNNQPVLTSSLTPEADGSFTRVEAVGDQVIVERYVPKDGVLQWESGFALDFELPKFGGHYATDDHHFLVFGQNNFDESDDVEVLRIVKYSRDWTARQDCAQLYGANTAVPFGFGTLRCAHYGDYLYIRTCHVMYQSGDRKNHQGNQTLNIQISTMDITDHYSVVMNPTLGFVGHSFNQFISTEDGVLVGVDHGDGNPRAFTICRYFDPAGQALFNSNFRKSCEYVQAYPMIGKLGENRTGATMGGFQTSDTSYLIAGTRVIQDEDYLIRSGFNIFMNVTPKEAFTQASVRSTQFTFYTEEENLCASNPHLLELNNNTYLLLWSERVITRDGYYYADTYTFPDFAETDRLSCLLLDGEGNPLSKIRHFSGSLSDCTPVVVDNAAVWYTTDNGLPVFYSLTCDALVRTDTASGTRTLTALTDLTLVSADYQTDGRFRSAKLSDLPAGQTISLSSVDTAQTKRFLVQKDTWIPAFPPLL